METSFGFLTDSSSGSEACLSSKFQFHNLNKVLHSKKQLHDMSTVVEYLFVLVKKKNIFKKTKNKPKNKK